MHVALLIVGMVVVIGVVSALSEWRNWSTPLVLVVVGVVISLIPGVPEVRLDPELVLTGLLPPLLYAAAIRTSLVDFRANRQAIALLSVGAVAFSTLIVGFATYLVLPAVSLAAGFAVGAVVAPPDAVAATAVGRRVGMPRRITTILEGESLVNDATALVALSAAIAAITGNITPWEIGGQFLLAAGGGVAIGLAVGLGLALIRQRLTDPVLDTTLSFVAPWVAFLPTEAIHSSGVLAVVVAGLVLGHKAPIVQSATSRIMAGTNWKTVQFLLENVVFLLIGLQLRQLIVSVHDSRYPLHEVLLGCGAVLVVTVAARIVWVFGSALVWRVGPRMMRANAWSWAASAVVSWAGMRGVVTLAASLLLPEQTPQRDLLQLAAFVVVAGSLLIQGTTLPWLVRRLPLPTPDAAQDALETASLVTDAAQAGLRRLDEVRTDDDPDEVIAQLRDRADRRVNLVWEQLGRSQTEIEPPGAVYRRLRLEMLTAERRSILTARDTGTVDDDVLREALAAVDLEESLLDRVQDTEIDPDAELTTPAHRAGNCEHLRDAPNAVRPRTPGQCAACLAEGTRWVHLRMCLTCGEVGCCDSSVGRHAERHFHETDHPVMRSVEPGEAWRWCYVDEQLG